MTDELKRSSTPGPATGPGRRPWPAMKALAGDERGIILVMFALMLPVMVAFIGLGVEVGLWFSQKRDIQAAADAAALAGAYEVAESRTSGVTTIATREATNNGWSSSSGSITVTYPYAFAGTSEYSADSNAIKVALTHNVNPMFIGYFIGGAVTINASAVAVTVTGSSEACILALGSSDQSSAIKVTGNSTTVTMSGCTAATNSDDDDAINVTENFTVDCIYSAGGIKVSGSGTPDTTACASPGKTNQPTVTDPYETGVTKPVDSDFDNCGSDGSNADGANYKAPPSTDYDLDPGVYCDIEFGVNNTTLTLSAGTYYINKGDFEVKSGGIVDGTAGVTLVFGDNTGSNDCGGFKVSGASFVNLTAPITEDGEPFTGLAIYRSSDCDASEKIEFTGTTTSTVLGAIYNPSGEIRITGTGALDGACLQLIADTVEFAGDSDIGSACDDVDILTITAGGIGQLVE